MKMNVKNSVNQKTLRQTVSYVGIGLHTGRKVSMSVRPAEVDSGIHIVRKDIPENQNLINARWYNVKETRLSTVLGNSSGTTVSTVEHLMAALHGCGVDNALVELDGPEIPIMDGSAEPFVKMIERVGTVDQFMPRNAIWLHRPIEVRDGDKYAILLPADSPRITVEIDFPGSIIGSQTLSVELVNEAFRNDIARARTFGFSSDIEQLRKKGLALGGSLNNAVLVDGDRVVNEEGLRFQDEFVRHKILDCMGDLALIGVPVLAHLYARKPGHELNNMLMNKLFAERESWSYITINEFNAMTGRNQDMVEAESEVSEKMLDSIAT